MGFREPAGVLAGRKRDESQGDFQRGRADVSRREGVPQRFSRKEPARGLGRCLRVPARVSSSGLVAKLSDIRVSSASGWGHGCARGWPATADAYRAARLPSWHPGSRNLPRRSSDPQRFKPCDVESDGSTPPESSLEAPGLAEQQTLVKRNAVSTPPGLGGWSRASPSGHRGQAGSSGEQGQPLSGQR